MQGIKQRLFTKTIPREVDDPARPVIDRQGEHTVNSFQQAPQTPPVVTLRQHLGIALGIENTAKRSQFLTQFSKVIYLSILKYDHLILSSVEWLPSVLKVNNRKPAHPQMEAFIVKFTFTIRTA